MTTTGACTCGSVRWRIEGAPVSCDVCHCMSCRRAVGAHAVPWITVRREQLAWEGTAEHYASSAGVTRTFCPRCGTSLTYETASRPDEIDVTLASTDDARIEPTGHIWMADAAAWERRAHTLPQYENASICVPVDRPTRGVRTWVSPKVVKGRPSGIAGRGVFAREPIDEDEVVEIKGGHIVDRATLQALPEHLQNSEIAIAEQIHMAAVHDDEYEDVMLFLNHSCKPNVGLRGNIVFVAMRAIAPGEELTVDYAMFNDCPGEAMTCACGSDDCRGTITGEDWRRPELQERYGAYFSAHLLNKIRSSA